MDAHGNNNWCSYLKETKNEKHRTKEADHYCLQKWGGDMITPASFESVVKLTVTITKLSDV